MGALALLGFVSVADAQSPTAAVVVNGVDDVTTIREPLFGALRARNYEPVTPDTVDAAIALAMQGAAITEENVEQLRAAVSADVLYLVSIQPADGDDVFFNVQRFAANGAQNGFGRSALADISGAVVQQMLTLEDGAPAGAAPPPTQGEEAATPEPPCNEHTFTYVNPAASTVWVSGSFLPRAPSGQWANNPAEGALEMVNDGSGTWSVTTQIDPPGSHQYKLVIDGTQWIPDPSAGATADDGLGGQNSVITVCADAAAPPVPAPAAAQQGGGTDDGAIGALVGAIVFYLAGGIAGSIICGESGVRCGGGGAEAWVPLAGPLITLLEGSGFDDSGHVGPLVAFQILQLVCIAAIPIFAATSGGGGGNNNAQQTSFRLDAVGFAGGGALQATGSF